MSAEAGLDSALPKLSALERRLSLKWVLIALAAVFFLIAWNRGIALLYGSFALLLATIAVAWLAPRINLAGLHGSRRYPREARVGESLHIALTLGTHGWPWRYMLEIEDRLPFAPGHAARLFVPNVGRTTQLEYDVPCLLRGRYGLTEVGVMTGFPLGLARAERKLSFEGTGRAPVVTVYPRTLPVGSLLTRACAGGDGSQPAGPRGRDLFREIRPYRHGDNMRDIHWRASARTGALLVKEFDQVDARQILLVLDLDPGVHTGEGAHYTLEFAVELAASIASWAIARGQAVGLAGGLGPSGGPRLWITPGQGTRQLRSLLEALVDVRADCPVRYAELLKAVAASGCRAQRILFRHGASWDGAAAGGGSLVLDLRRITAATQLPGLLA